MSQLVTIKSMAGFSQPTSDLPPEDALFVRPSSYASYALCAYRLLLADHPDFDSGSNEPPGFGTGVHGVIEHFLTTGEVLATHEDVLAHWELVMKERGEDIHEYADAQTLAKLSLEVKHAFMVWYNTFFPTIKEKTWLAVEERVMRGLGVLPSGREVWVSGAPDLVMPGEVNDWKTAGRGWKEGKAQSNLVQMAAYAWLSEHHTEITKGVHVVYDRSKRTWSWEETTIQLNPQRIQSALVALWDMARSLDSGVGVATPHIRGGFGDGRGWHCKPQFCGAWNPCPHKSLIPDGMDQQVRPPIRWEA